MAEYSASPRVVSRRTSRATRIAVIEGERITHFACATCHAIGSPAPTAPSGQCWRCHMRHEFSLEQARKPETCNACHIGPDHPQWEIYVESSHGIAYHTGGDRWHWDGEAGDADGARLPGAHLRDLPSRAASAARAPPTTSATGSPGTCSRRSASGAPRWAGQPHAHAGRVSRLPQPELRAGLLRARRRRRPTSVNDLIRQSEGILAGTRRAEGLLTPAPFDEPIEFVAFETWHHYGRTAKFGTWMQGPDYAQWHGAYEVVKGLAGAARHGRREEESAPR